MYSYYWFFWGTCKELQRKHCVKSVQIWSFSGPYFPVFGREKTPYLDTFHAVKGHISQVFCLGTVVAVRITSNQGSPRKRPDGMPGMSPRICIKNYFLFIVVIVNSDCITPTLDYCQLHLNNLVLCVFDIVIS